MCTSLPPRLESNQRGIVQQPFLAHICMRASTHTHTQAETFQAIIPCVMTGKIQRTAVMPISRAGHRCFTFRPGNWRGSSIKTFTESDSAPDVNQAETETLSAQVSGPKFIVRYGGRTSLIIWSTCWWPTCTLITIAHLNNASEWYGDGTPFF